MTDLQEFLYLEYMQKNPLMFGSKRAAKMFDDYRTLAAIWTHPRVLHQRYEKMKEALSKNINKLVKKQTDENQDNEHVNQLSQKLENYIANNAWWKDWIDSEKIIKDIAYSNKLLVMLEILNKCEEKDEKW